MVRFEIPTPLGFAVRTTDEYWKRIVTEKHPNMRGQEEEVKKTLSDPDLVKQSVGGPNVLLFYRPRQEGWTVEVVRRLNGEVFLITCYLTAPIKKGTEIWKRR
ncbi:MAG: hypothetical protein OEV08_07420 [Nitrospira sp.]|nr:hypothetical protein [Nitrospira sp.]